MSARESRAESFDYVGHVTKRKRAKEKVKIANHELKQLNGLLTLVRNAHTFEIDLDDQERLVKEQLQSRTILKHDLLEYLTDLKYLQHNWRSLPFTIFLLACLMVSLAHHIQTHAQIDQTLLAQNMLEGPEFSGSRSEEHVPDIDRFSDFWDWMDQVVAPTFFTENRQAQLSPQNIVARGIRLISTRSDIESCKLKKFQNIYGTPCHPFHTRNKDSYGVPKTTAISPELLEHMSCNFWGQSLGLSTEAIENIQVNCPAACGLCNASSCTDNTEFVDPRGKACSFWKAAAVDSALSMEQLILREAFSVHDSDSFQFTILSTLTIEEVQYVISVLRDFRWLDNSTKTFSVEFFAINAELGTALLVQQEFDMRRGGFIRTRRERLNVFLGEYRDAQDYAIDVIYLISIVLLIYFVIAELVSYTRNGAFRSIYLKNVWHHLDWLLILLAIVQIVYFSVGMSHVSNQIKTELRKDLDFNYESIVIQNRRLIELMQTAHIHVFVLTSICTSQILLVMVRFFKAFDVQPRLAVVAQTFASVATDLAHFAVVFLLIFFCFVCVGMLYFGHRYETCSTFVRCSFMSMQIVMGETSMFYDLVEVEPFVGVVWYVAFIFIVVMLLVNLLVAITIDVYVDVKGAIGKQAPTLLAQMSSTVSYIWANLTNRKEHIDISELLFLLHQDEGVVAQHDEFDPETLFRLFGIPENRGGALIVRAHRAIIKKKMQVRGYSASDAFSSLAQLDDQFGELFYRVTKLEAHLSEQNKRYVSVLEQLKKAAPPNL
eukprot:c2389_g1_i1.p1 GENE.c2389_g1_i1~~c2389_g1_i1.p1  ORF type:complete len:786 (+),score=140.92 c2389_g1_i1:41-2359(+)